MNKTIGLLFILTLAGSARAVKVLDILDELTTQQRQEAEELIPGFDRIDGYLELSHSDSDSLVEYVKELLAKEEKKSSFLQKIKPNREKIQFKKALALFASLPVAASTCDFNSYKILAQIQLGLEVDLSSADCSSKSIKVFKDFARRHAEYCRPRYEHEYRLALQEGESKDQKSFRIVEQLSREMHSNRCLLDPKGAYPKLTEDCADELTDGLLKLVEDEFHIRTDSGFRTVWDAIQQLVPSHLVHSCRVRNELLRNVLAPAIYDAALEDEHQEEFLYPGKGYLEEGLQHFRACQYVLNNTQELMQFVVRSIARQMSD